MVTNEQGQVGLKYYQTIPHVISIRDREYAFVVKFNICFCWINFEDVSIVLETRRKKKCCGGTKPREYFYANESDVRIWTGVSSR